jgi:hypothetical protein
VPIQVELTRHFRYAQHLLLAPLLFASLQAATKTACPAGYPAKCTYSDLQAAFKGLACGDELQIAPVEWIGTFWIGTSCAANPITVTTLRKQFLPEANTRISPSHAQPIPGITHSTGNIPMLVTATAEAPLILSYPANGWHFVGIGFSSKSKFISYDKHPFTYQLINMNGTDPVSENLLLDNLYFDRIYLTGPEDNSVYIQNAVYLQVKSVTVKNSFCKDIALTGGEAHCFGGSDILGPVTFTNNYISSAGIPLIMGGSQAHWWYTTRKDGNIPVGFQATLNYFFKPHKWWPDPVHNWDYADYQAIWGPHASPDHPCTKNLGELKNGVNATWQYNVHENQWDFFPCEGQSYGMALTPREMSGSVTTHEGGKVIDPVTLTWPEENLKVHEGAWVCPLLGKYFYCRQIVSVDSGKKTVKVSPIPSGWPATAASTKWLYSWDASESVQNATVRDSIFRNVAAQTNVLGQSFSVPAGTQHGEKAVTLQNARFINNLFYNSHRQNAPFLGWRAYTSDWPMDPNSRILPVGLMYDHNTWYVPDRMQGNVNSVLSIGNWPGADGAPIDQFSFTNNVAPSSQYGVLGSADVGSNLSRSLTTFMTGNAKVLHNSLPDVANLNNCTAPQVCSGNKSGKISMDAQFADASHENFKLKPNSVYAKSGTDGSDMGVDVTLLPFINNLTLTPGHYSSKFDWELSKVNNDTPCVVEVSTSRNLYSGIAPYSVVNDLNPVFFIRPDTDHRVNPKLTKPVIDGLHRTFTVGQEATVADDNDGTKRDLRLTPGTEYWGRLMCGGDTRWFRYSTLAPTDTAVWGPPQQVTIMQQVAARK